MRFLFLLALLTGCYLHSYPVTPAIAEASTYEVTISDTWSGTAWVVDAHHLVTAGHVCEHAKDPGATFVVRSSTGRSVLAHPLAWEKSEPDAFVEADLCVLTADGPLAPPLVIADAEPVIGTQMAYAGYPLSKFTVSHGVVMPDGYTSAACDHGASGSAVFTPRGVFGVLVHLHWDPVNGVHSGIEGCFNVDLKSLKAMLDFAGVGYTSAPPDIGNEIPLPLQTTLG